MAIRHSKVSGELNTDPALVGGEDWDSAHAYGPGSIFSYGMARIDADPVLGVDTENAWCFGGITGVSYNDLDYKVTIAIDQENAPVLPGSSVEYLIIFVKESAAWCPESLDYIGINTSGMAYNIRPLNGVNAPFSESVRIFAKLYCLVT